MAESAKLQIDSKESIALDLMARIATHEKLGANTKNYRKDLLDLYAECLEATSNRRSYSKGDGPR